LGGHIGWSHWVVTLGGHIGWSHWVVTLGGHIRWSHWVVTLGGHIVMGDFTGMDNGSRIANLRVRILGKKLECRHQVVRVRVWNFVRATVG